MTLEARRILVVEDSEAVRNILEILLRGYGFIVESTRDDGTATPLLHAHGFDLIVTDTQHVIRWLRDRGDTTPVVLLQDVAKGETRAFARRYGAVEVLKKPVTHDTLLRAIEEALAFQSGPAGDLAS